MFFVGPFFKLLNIGTNMLATNPAVVTKHISTYHDPGSPPHTYIYIHTIHTHKICINVHNIHIKSMYIFFDLDIHEPCHQYTPHSTPQLCSPEESLWLCQGHQWMIALQLLGSMKDDQLPGNASHHKAKANLDTGLWYFNFLKKSIYTICS